MSVHDFSVQKPNGETVSLKEYSGKVLLIVNTATKCGLAPQFEWLEELWNTFPHDTFAVLGFPCAQFANQEPETNETVEQACKINFGVTFPLFAKIEVNGVQTHPLYQYLKSQKWGWFSSAIKWNFTKFLIDQDGNVIVRYAPTVLPKDIKRDIEKLLRA